MRRTEVLQGLTTDFSFGSPPDQRHRHPESLHMGVERKKTGEKRTLPSLRAVQIHLRRDGTRGPSGQGYRKGVPVRKADREPPTMPPGRRGIPRLEHL